MTWYYANAGDRTGPVSDEEFFQLIANGRIRDDTLVWKQGMTDWRPYAEVAPALAVPPPLRPSNAVYPQPTAGSVHLNAAQSVFPGRVFGGFWIRVVARLIDGVVLWIVSQVLGGALAAVIFPDSMKVLTTIRANPESVTPEQMFMVFAVLAFMMFVSLLVGLAYEVFFVRRSGATPGKMALGLRIERADGSRLSVGRIIGRHFAQMLSSLVLCIGYILAAFDDEKRTLHDHICDTRVVKTR